ncbi:cell division protein SepF [Candidatus Woesearchaeota archaeon]|nr:cell division protein SepF [Candidatus Woesearchaeota archaeon]
MADFFSNVKARINGLMGGKEPEAIGEGGEQEYVELDTASTERRGKVLVKKFVMGDFQDVKPVIDALREGNTIAIVNISLLKEKDMIEAKRAVSKLKKTTDAISGDIRGLDSDYIIATPSFAKIHAESSSVSAPQANVQGAAAAGQEETF